MSTLRQLARRPGTLPAPVTLHAVDLAEARGRLDAYRPAAAARLSALAETALVESVVSASRLEGVPVDPARVGMILFGNPLLLDRSEREIRGLRDALTLVSDRGARLPLEEATFRRLHRLVRGGGRRDSGGSDGPSGGMGELVSLTKRCLNDRWVRPEIVAAALELDLLCARPFGPHSVRMAHLGLLLVLAHGGEDVGRSVSLPRLTEDSRERFRAVVTECARGFEDGWNDPWPFIVYRLVVLKTAARELLEALRRPAPARTTKAELVRQAIEAADGRVTLAGLMRACPGVGEATVRGVLRRLRGEGRLVCFGKGPGAPWGKPPEG